MIKLFYLLGGTVIGFLLSAIGFAALALIADAVWRSDREDQQKDRKIYLRKMVR